MTTFLFFLVTGVSLFLSIVARKEAQNRKVTLLLTMIILCCLLALSVFFITKAYEFSSF